MSEKVQTDYAKAFAEWQASQEYADLLKTMRHYEPHTEPRYLINCIRIAFDAGWNAKPDTGAPLLTVSATGGDTGGGE